MQRRRRSPKKRGLRSYGPRACPADIRAQGGVARMSDPKIIKEIQNAVSIPVMAKCRIGHFVEAQILEALGVGLHRRIRGAHSG